MKKLALTLSMVLVLIMIMANVALAVEVGDVFSSFDGFSDTQGLNNWEYLSC